MLDERVTLVDLEEWRACRKARAAFAKQFPEGATWRELIPALAAHREGLDWWQWLVDERKPLWVIRDQFEEVEVREAQQFYRETRDFRRQLGNCLITHEQFKKDTAPALRRYTRTLRRILRDIANEVKAHA